MFTPVKETTMQPSEHLESTYCMFDAGYQYQHIKIDIDVLILVSQNVMIILNVFDMNCISSIISSCNQ
jgi:hypothetical protein